MPRLCPTLRYGASRSCGSGVLHTWSHSYDTVRYMLRLQLMGQAERRPTTCDRVAPVFPAPVALPADPSQWPRAACPEQLFINAPTAIVFPPGVTSTTARPRPVVGSADSVPLPSLPLHPPSTATATVADHFAGNGLKRKAFDETDPGPTHDGQVSTAKKKRGPARPKPPQATPVVSASGVMVSQFPKPATSNAPRSNAAASPSTALNGYEYPGSCYLANGTAGHAPHMAHAAVGTDNGFIRSGMTAAYPHS